jgi:membrane protease subunit HflK
MERVLTHTRKVLVNDKGNNLMVLPLDQIMRGQGGVSSNTIQDSSSNSLLRLPPANSNDRASKSSSYNLGTIMDQRRANAQRNDTQREGRE